MCDALMGFISCVLLLEQLLPFMGRYTEGKPGISFREAMLEAMSLLPLTKFVA